MTQKGQTGILILVGILIMVAVGGAYLFGKSQTPKPSPAPVTSPTSQPTSSPSPTIQSSPTPQQSNNKFDINKITFGDRISGVSVKSVGPYRTDSTLPLAKNAKVSFDGEITITGSYYYLGPNRITSDTIICVEKLNQESLTKIPILQSDNRFPWFCFDNVDLASKLLGPVGSSGTITVVIDNYSINYYPSEVGNTAKLVRLISKI